MILYYICWHAACIPITIPLPFHSECALCFGTGKDSVWFSIRNWITWFQFHCQLTFTSSYHISTCMYTYVWGIHRISPFQYTHHFSCGWGKTKTIVFSLPLILVFKSVRCRRQEGRIWHWLSTKKHMKVHWLVTKQRVHIEFHQLVQSTQNTSPPANSLKPITLYLSHMGSINSITLYLSCKASVISITLYLSNKGSIKSVTLSLSRKGSVNSIPQGLK